jgi:hypothetical protein
MTTFSKRLLITAIEADDDNPYTKIWDLDKTIQTLVLVFGNGVWGEVHVIGESHEALNILRTILKRGGYSPTEAPFQGATLYQQGNECWEGFIFIDPTPRLLEN